MTPGSFILVFVAIALTIEGAIIARRQKQKAGRPHGFYCEQGRRRYWDDD
jgi:hypothetical protein